MPDHASGLDETFGIRAREILNRGPEALGSIPSAEQFEPMSAEERHQILAALRVELYALSSILADEAVGRALAERSRYPPVGLLRSLFSDFGVISASPSPLPTGSITDFRLLGKALIDTMVFHLDSYLKDLRKSERQWLVDRLGRLLALFRLEADRQGRARLRDAFSFIYGGLQFGTSTCVQLAEVMTRLSSFSDLSDEKKIQIMKRSIRPAYDLASLNVDDVATAYAKLQPDDAGPGAGTAHNPAGWMDPAKFAIKSSGNEPWKIVLGVDLQTEPDEGEPQRRLDPTEEARRRYPTQGCPARLSPAGGRSPMGRLWEWTVDLANQMRLL